MADTNPRGQKRRKDGSGAGKGRIGGLRAGRNRASCAKGPGQGRGGGRGGGRNRKG